MTNAGVIGFIAEYFPGVFEPNWEEKEILNVRVGPMQSKISKWISFQTSSIDSSNQLPEFIKMVKPSKYYIGPGDNSEEVEVTLHFDGK